MKQTQRHNGIIELVKQQGYVSTEELVEHFSVSPQTIRRDLMPPIRSAPVTGGWKRSWTGTLTA